MSLSDLRLLGLLEPGGGERRLVCLVRVERRQCVRLAQRLGPARGHVGQPGEGVGRTTGALHARVALRGRVAEQQLRVLAPERDLAAHGHEEHLGGDPGTTEKGQRWNDERARDEITSDK